VARRDVPTCGLDEHIGDVRRRVSAAEWDVCVVTNKERVVLGLLRDEQLAQDGDKVVAQVMRPGPSTFRPHVTVEEIAHYMINHDLPSSPVTTSDGRLVGLLMVDDAVRVVHDRHAEHATEGKAS
jgi:Mg/Co/Ni transporter MgtE